MGTALQRRLNLAATVASHAANIADAAETGGHLPNQPVCTGMTAPIVKVMVANKLPATVLAQVFLLVIAGFAVRTPPKTYPCFKGIATTGGNYLDFVQN